MANILYYDTITEMVSDTTSGAVPGDTIIVGGYNLLGDGGGGTFRCWDDSEVVTWDWVEDFGLLFKHITFSTYPFWFQRLVNTPFISVKWFGAWGDGVHLDGVFVNRAFNACTGHNTGNTVMEDTGDTTRTRIYFPAGVYKLEIPIAKWEDPEYVEYDVSGLEIVGERSILIPDTTDPFPSDYCMMLRPTNNLIIRGLTFRGFTNAIRMGSANPANVYLDYVIFINISRVALDIFGANILFTIENSNWTDCQYGLSLLFGEVVIRACEMFPREWRQADDAFMFIGEGGSVSMKNSICIPPKSVADSKAHSCAWVNNWGNFRAVDVDFRAPLVPFIDQQVGSIVHNNTDSKKWSSLEISEKRLVFKSCKCNCSGVAIKLYKLPNAIVMEDNIGFTNRNFVIDYFGEDDLQTLLHDDYVGLFSMKLQNVPFFGTVLWQSNLLYSVRNSTSVPVRYKEQLAFLPFIRINSGLDCIGYAENFDSPSVPTPVRFFMGKLSYNVNPNKNAVFGDYSFEIKLANVTTDPTEEGGIYLFNNYRVFCKVVGGVSEIDQIIPFGVINPDLSAPHLTMHDGLLQITTKGWDDDHRSEPYGIYYQIRNLVPPAALPHLG